jgi:aminoglycoside phosphotransferase (APT) family kinase protein
VLCHFDLGAEHVLTDAPGARVTGVIDWTDATPADPAYDLGLILRDLGAETFDAALVASGFAGDPGIRERAFFCARCAALEDAAFGCAPGREALLEASLGALRGLFPGPG